MYLGEVGQVCVGCGASPHEGPCRPRVPANRILREGEMPCRWCGYGERQHWGWRQPGGLGHGYTFSWPQRVLAWLVCKVWATSRALYVLGVVDEPRA